MFELYECRNDGDKLIAEFRLQIDARKCAQLLANLSTHHLVLISYEGNAEHFYPEDN